MKLPLLATALVAAALILAADAAHASYKVTVAKRTLVVTGNGASERLALRANRKRVQVDVRDDRKADFSVARRRFDRILVRAGAGADRVRIDESKVVFTRKERTTLEGGPGNDTLLGGRGAERLLGGDGNDVADGNRGADSAFLGAGDDRFAWDAGDGTDRVEGSDGRDTATVTGSAAAEAFQIDPDGVDAGAATVRLGALEQVDVSARGGADSLTVDPLAVQAVTGNLGGADGASDRVTVSGTQGDDVIDVSGADGSAAVAGLAVPVTLAGAEPGDQLVVNAMAGFDRVASALAATTLALTADGGAEDDTLAGGPAAETLLGGDGNDVADGNQGNDRALLGAGDDTFTWDAGDGSDAVEGDAGLDKLDFNGSGANESLAVAAAGPRVRFTRDVGNVTMDLDDVERIDAAALGGLDKLTAGDVSGTDLSALRIGLGVDGAADQVIVNGSAGADAVALSGAAGGATATGLPNGLMLNIAGAQVPDDRLSVNTLAGADTVNATGLSSMRLTVDAGSGDDRVRGGAGPDLLLGGDGHDLVDGNLGDDTALLGAGDDELVWDPGDGSDTVEGQDGRDAMTFNGSGAGEVFDVAANGTRVRFTRDLGSVLMDLDDVEQIDAVALAGADAVFAADVAGTDLDTLNVALGSDGEADDVVVDGSGGNDVATLSGAAGSALLNGLGLTVAVSGAQVPDDRLAVRLLAGDDALDAAGLATDAVALAADGDTGNDNLRGGDGPDILRGGAGDDILRGGPGNDDLDGGPGNNVVDQD